MEGYALLPQDVTIKFNANGVLKITDKGVATAKTRGDDTLEIKNYPEGKVPLSGKGGVVTIMLLGTLIMGVAGVQLVVRKTGKVK